MKTLLDIYRNYNKSLLESSTKKIKGNVNNKLSDKADDMVDEIRIKKLVKELCSLIERFGKNLQEVFISNSTPNHQVL